MAVTGVRPTGREEQPADYTGPGLGLRRAVVIFSGTFSARVLAQLVLQPFTEWIIHVTVLHWKPRTVGRLTLDPLGARRHRQHHRDRDRHFLIHSTYRPRGRYYRYVYRAHRLHHFRNERYWFGVTVHVADHVFRTFPAKDAVPVSDTAFTVGVGSDA